MVNWMSTGLGSDVWARNSQIRVRLDTVNSPFDKHPLVAKSYGITLRLVYRFLISEHNVCAWISTISLVFVPRDFRLCDRSNYTIHANVQLCINLVCRGIRYAKECHWTINISLSIQNDNVLYKTFNQKPWTECLQHASSKLFSTEPMGKFYAFSSPDLGELYHKQSFAFSYLIFFVEISWKKVFHSPMKVHT